MPYINSPEEMHKVTACTAKGKRCVALDKQRKKWLYDTHSEAEAEIMAEAIADRGYILKQWWRQA